MTPPVHPRACGEQASNLSPAATVTGSSPRLRGTDIRFLWRCRCSRFIPAPAGNSKLFLIVLLDSSVHPRACGEQSFTSHENNSSHGSSPRLRGTVLCRLCLMCSYRFIPAPAGNSPERAAFWFGEQVHPRACGEQFCLNFRPAFSNGSSPRLRGTVPPYLSKDFGMRFIPAPAGNRSMYSGLPSE